MGQSGVEGLGDQAIGKAWGEWAGEEEGRGALGPDLPSALQGLPLLRELLTNGCF